MTDTVIIACPRCGGLNRAPVARLEARETPDCGKCHAPLFAGHPAELEKVMGRGVARWLGWDFPF